MAMSLAIRKACRSVALPALRAIASPRILASSSITAPIAHFSTAASDVLKQPEEKLIKKITKTQFKSSKPFHCCNIQMPEAPTNFPFEIDDYIYESGIRLKREHAGEKIVVDVDEPIYPENGGDKPHVPLKLRITKEDGTNLVISLWAHADYVGHPEVEINTMHISNEMSKDEEDFWRGFIKEKGIDDSIGRYMMNYMNWRAAQKNLIFWGKVNSFLKE